GWKHFQKSNGGTMYGAMQGGDNTLLGSAVVASDTARIWEGERLVRISTELYANHCVQTGGGSCTSGSADYPDGDRIASHEAVPSNNNGGGLGNWHDMNCCCSGRDYGSGKICNNASFRTTSEAQAGWCPDYWLGGDGYFGTDTFARATCDQSNSECWESNWASPNHYAYDYAIFLREDKCTDGVKNTNETAIDCGGICGPCDVGEECLVASDCLSGVCDANRCADYEPTCLSIHLLSPELSDGIYTIAPEGSGSTTAFSVFCDMSTDGGGWTQCGAIDETGLGNVCVTEEDTNTGLYIEYNALRNASFCMKFYDDADLPHSPRSMMIHNRTPNKMGDFGYDDRVKIHWGENPFTPYSYASNAVLRCENLTTGDVFDDCSYAAHTGEPWQSSAFSFSINNVPNAYSAEVPNRLLLGPTFKPGTTGGRWNNFGAATNESNLADTWGLAENKGDLYLREDRCSDSIQNNDESDVDCGGVCAACAPALHCSVSADCQSGVCDGGYCSTYMRSCLQILTASPDAQEGKYTIDPDAGGILPSIEVFCDMTTEGGGWTQISEEHFDGALASGWSRTNMTTECGRFGHILGGYNILGVGDPNEKTYDLMGVPHTQVMTTLDYIKIDSWDTEDAFVSLGEQEIFRETFCFCPHGCDLTGGLCGGSQECGYAAWGQELTYPVQGVVQSVADQITLAVGADIDEGPGNESWGMDNIFIWVR
ncbi:hypothetical protein KAI87_02980, partial [Myxococcota bacterium]|nr:hypothetical protein [Myxococcota bacterium]